MRKEAERQIRRHLQSTKEEWRGLQWESELLRRGEVNKVRSHK